MTQSVRVFASQAGVRKFKSPAQQTQVVKTGVDSSIGSSLAKGFAHGPLSLHPWQIELDFVISADRHLAVFSNLAYKDDITFDQWVLLTVSYLGDVKWLRPVFTFSTAYT